MDWYYAIKGEQKGPVGDADFRQLVQQGVVTTHTLVWRQGMAGWAAYGADATSAVVAPPGSVICAACGRPVPETDAFALSGAHYCAVCKPQILQRITEGKPIVSAAAEETRRKYIGHEASVKSIGLLDYIGAAFLFFAASFGLREAQAPGKSAAIAIGVVAFFVLFGIILILLGTGLRRLRPWARIPSAILAGLGMLGFPFGTLINGYVLYLLLCKKGATVFSRDYQAVIQQTPHIKYRTSPVVWILLGIVLLLIIGGITASFLHSRH